MVLEVEISTVSLCIMTILPVYASVTASAGLQYSQTLYFHLRVVIMPLALTLSMCPTLLQLNQTSTSCSTVFTTCEAKAVM